MWLFKDSLHMDKKNIELCSQKSKIWEKEGNV